MSSFTQSTPSKQVPKMAVAKEDSAEPKSASKMHRRSRSGCYTCRLRRKKCEEGKPACKACTHLGLQCNYGRPHWWSSGEQRRQQKEIIKNAIKQTQNTKKTQPTQPTHSSLPSPPSLCHSVPSVPTTADIYTDSLPQTRQGSVDSPFSQVYDFNKFPSDGIFQIPPHPQHMVPHAAYGFSPYEIDIKTERSVFVNDIQMRRDSTISTFSTFQPPLANGLPPLPSDSWIQQEHHESHIETLPEEPLDFEFFDFPHGQMSPNHEAQIDVEPEDRYLFNHFLDRVIKLVFPVLDANQHGSVRTDVVIPALESNKAYLHCCLSIAGTHMRATQSLIDPQVIDADINRHRYAAIAELCAALNDLESDRSRILEATLAMIFFQCSVGRSKDALPDIPWHSHFQAASEVVNTLQLPLTVVSMAEDKSSRPPFNMTLTSWIDILGATMRGRTPLYADTYRELNLKGASAGLAELMGCDDKIMFLISEIACLETQAREGVFRLDPNALNNYVFVLAHEIRQTEPQSEDIQNCFSTTGAIRPKQLRTNLTAIFAFAARTYLCSLVPGNHPNSPSMLYVLNHFTWAMNYIPEGPDGFDRCLAWPLLIAGANSSSQSPFRSMFADRCSKLGDAAEFGSLGRVRELLHDIWAVNDNLPPPPPEQELQCVHWRDVMASKEWDFLLI